jgi:HPt (histidine-containing phosphotransfer) domain-containing protein
MPTDTIDSENLIGRSSMDSMEIDEGQREALKQRVYAIYLERSPATFAEMRTALAEQRYEDVRELAHYLKSSSANIGASALAEQMAEVQHASEAAAHERLDLLIENAQVLFLRVIAELKKSQGGDV